MSGKLQRPGWPPSRKPIHFPVSYLERVQIRCVVWDTARDRSQIIMVESCNSRWQFLVVVGDGFGHIEATKTKLSDGTVAQKSHQVKIDYASIINCVNTLSGLITILIKSSNCLLNISWQNCRQLINLHRWEAQINIRSKSALSKICVSLILKVSLVSVCEKRHLLKQCLLTTLFSFSQLQGQTRLTRRSTWRSIWQFCTKECNRWRLPSYHTAGC